MKRMDLRGGRGGRLLLVVAFALIGVLLIGRMLTTLYVEILWFRSAGYSDVFWRRAFWEWGIRGLSGLLVIAVIYVNLRFVARTLGGIRIKRRLGGLEISEQIPKHYISLGIIGTSVLMGLWFGASVPRAVGLQTLFVLGAPDWGVVEPILGKDLTFYVILLPVLGALVTFAMILAFLAFTLSVAGYAATGAVQWGKGQLYTESQPRVHLAILVAAFFVFLAARFYLGRYMLLLDGSSSIQGIVGFTDANARLPAFRILTVLSAFTAIGAVWSGVKGRVLPLATTFGALILGGLLVGQAYPAVVQRFRVEPNELDRESEYIENALRFTHLGFGLEGLEKSTFAYNEDEEVDWSLATDQFAGLPVWSSDALLTAYREIEARRSYYDFARVTVDRYEASGGTVVVALAVREVNPNGIEDPNWQNLHLRRTFVTGMGAVASAASARTPEGRPPMFLADLPPRFTESGVAPEALRLTRPEVFIGSRPRSRLQQYVILTSDEHPRADGSPAQPGVDFPAGIELSSLFRKLVLALKFRDANLLFASEISSDSRLVFRRQALERVQRISGDLIRFLEPPYPVVSEGRIVWMVEGFTGTRWFPLSTPHALPARRPVRYIRNSVKITVDAVTGEVNFYVVDEEDALLAAYRSGFPNLFRPLSEMPADLRPHIRYPKELLKLQAEVLNQYHQETAPVFHRRQDVWAAPRELAKGTTPVPYQPEYGFFRLPGDDEPSFLLSTVFVPDGRQNLTAILVARNDPDRYGELELLEIPGGIQVPGPRQIEALVEQDPEISQQFSLWRTGGSQVWTGHLHVVPVGETLLYMEPVFLAAEEDAIPELRRFVVSDGRRVAMRADLGEAIAALALASGQAAPVTRAAALGVEVPEPVASGEWPRDALGLLERAEERLRAGDFQGFGEALAELKTLLERLSDRPGGGP
jgi:uncharacterized protein